MFSKTVKNVVNQSNINVGGSLFINGKSVKNHNPDSIQGSGIQNSKIVTAERFNHIKSQGVVDINFKVSDSYMIEIVADDNLIDLIEISYSGDTLTVGMKPNCSFETSSDISVNINAPSLKSISITGSGDATINDINELSFRANVSGSGDIDISGSAESAILDISGSGDIDASDLVTSDLIATVKGSGDIDAYSNGTLSAQVLGSGDIKVRGMPRVAEANSLGSGSIKIK